MSNSAVQNSSQPKLNRDGLKGISGIYALIVAQFALLLAVSGRIDWMNSWLYLGVFLLCHTVYAVLFTKIDPQLLNERGKLIRKSTKPFDKLFFILWRVLGLLILVVAGLDVGRYQWSTLPMWVVFGGGIVSILSFSFSTYAMTANTYFAASVRIQDDRNQTVCNTGPYRYIRHPGYIGMMISTLCIPIILGSLLGLVPAIAITFLVIIRTALEDSTLKNELPGYRAYTKVTRYRLLPYIW